MALKIGDTCGKTSFEYLIEYTPKQPCYADVAKTTDTLSNWWFVVEFENPNSLKTCLEMNGTEYKDHKLTVRSLSHAEYDEICGLFDITKARTKRFKKYMKGKRLTIVLASNVSSRVTSDALYKFFSFPGDPVEVAIDRARKIALIAYDTEEQGVVALACDQAILGPAMVRIELYRPEQHGKDLISLLKVGRTGDIAHTGARTGFIQISERNAGMGPDSPATAPHRAHPPHAAPAAVPSGYPPGYPPGFAAPQASHGGGGPVHIVTNFSAAPSSAHNQAYPAAAPRSGSASNAHSPFSLAPSGTPVAPQPSRAGYPSSGAPEYQQQQNPYTQQHQQNPYNQQHSPTHQQQRAGPPTGRPETTQQDWSKIIPTAKYTVTTTTTTDGNP